MRLLVDDRWFHDGGIGKFSHNIVDRCPPDVQIEFLGKTWKIADPLSPYKLWSEIERRKPDLFWSPGFMPPIVTNIPAVISIHDLIHLEFGNAKQKFYYNNIIRPLARRCRRIITVSNFSKGLIVDWLKVPGDFVTVIPNGVSEAFFNVSESAKFEKPYFVYVGNRKPYKNITRMLQAFSVSGLAKDFLFLLSGKADAEISSTIEQFGLTGSVVFGGYITEESLPSIYKGAVASVFVSLHEGFGIPNIEAFAAGTAVITANATALPEIVEDGAILVDPYSIEEISSAMKRVATDEVLRQELIGKGKAISKKYTWDNTATQFWQAIK